MSGKYSRKIRKNSEREGSYDPNESSPIKHIYNYGRCGGVYMLKRKFIMFHCADCELRTSSLVNYLKHLRSHWNNFDSEAALKKACEDGFIEDKTDTEDVFTIESVTIEPVVPDLDTHVEHLNEHYENNTSLSEDPTKYDLHEFMDLQETVKELKEESLDLEENEDEVKTSLSDDYCKSENIESEDEFTDWFLQHRSKSGYDIPYTCSVCNRNFLTASRLNAHARIHTEERKYKCQICGFAFKEEYNLRAHIKRHSGKKRYHCEHCPKKFHTRSEQMRHERSHTGEKPYVCAYCGQTYSSAGSLHEHTKRHKNQRAYACETCGKRFFDTHQLKEHSTVHKDERNFMCETCNATFKRSKTLKAHIKLHENKREYICEICQAAFNQRPSLTMHMKNRHRVVPSSTLLRQVDTDSKDSLNN